MARSRPRKAAREKAAQIRRDQQARNIRDRRLWDLAHDISGAHLPEVEASDRTAEAIEQWFEEDPTAPLVLFRYPPGDAEGRIYVGDILISVNARAIERELRARGIDERHPDWEPAFHLTQRTVMEVAERVARREYLD